MLDQLSSLKIIPVVAIEKLEKTEPLADSLESGGLPVAEITLRTDAGLSAIKKLASRSNFLVGAGTVHSAEQARQVTEAGAKFVVTPGFNPRTVQWCVDNDVPVFPGVSSPTDLETAIEFGLQVVKFFPAELVGGVPMLNAFQGPYGGMRFIPTGGIGTHNLQSYLSLKNVVACGGSWMVKSDLIAQGNFDTIEKLTADAISLVQSFNE